MLRTANGYNQEYIIKERIEYQTSLYESNVCGESHAWNANFINNLFHNIRDSIQTVFMVYEHNQAHIQRLFTFQACDFRHTFNATYRDVLYPLLL